MLLPPTGYPYEPASRLRQWWRRNHPKPINTSEAVNEHSLTVGISGSGKSYKVTQEIVRDYYAGHSVILFDPLYSTFRDTLHMCIHLGIDPSKVFIIDLTRPDIGQLFMNFLEFRLGMAGVTRDGLITTIRNIPHWRDSIGERMISVLYNLFKSLQLAGLPLVLANRFLMDYQFRFDVLEICNDPELNMFWDHIFKMRDAKTIVESSRNKLSQMIDNDFIRPFISQNYSNFSFKDLMNQNVIILINLSKRYFKDDARTLLSALLLYKIYEELLTRENEKNPHPVSLYLEEAHEYFIPQFVFPLLTGARKFGVGVNLITQSLEVFFQSERNLIMGVVGSISAFAVNSVDAKILRDEMFLFDGTTPKRVKRDIWGVYEVEERYNSGDESLNARNELQSQIQREFIMKIRGKKENRVWVATTSEMPQVEISEAVETEYRRASARAWRVGSFLSLPAKSSALPDDPLTPFL